MVDSLKPADQIEKSTPACGGHWYEYAYCSTLAASRDAWKAMAGETTNVLHDLHITDSQSDYGVRAFTKDHPVVTDWAVDSAAATAGGLAALATFETGPGAVVAGAATGAAVDSSLRAWLGDEHYVKNALRGAALGGGAGAAMKLQSAIADVYGATVAGAIETQLSRVSPALSQTVSRVVLPTIERTSNSSVATRVAEFGADRVRGNIYYQTTARPLRAATDEIQLLTGDVRHK